MKYKPLTSEELSNLEKEFIQFLSSNTITRTDWDTIKTTPKADDLINMFSDIVWDKILDNIKYLQHVTDNEFKLFYCGEKEIFLRAMNIVSGDVNFNKNALQEIALASKKSQADVTVFKTSKAYSPDRNIELFKMLENGCSVSSKELFDSIPV